MDKALEVTYIKTEPTDSTSSDRVEISSEMQVKSVKQESDCLVQSEIDIKTEPEEDKSGFLVIAGTSHDMCHNVEVKVETIDEIFDNACENLFNEVLQDLMKDANEKKVEITTSDSNLSEAEINKLEQEEFHSNTNEEHPCESKSNSLDKFLVRNKQILKDKKHICHVCHKMFGDRRTLDRHLLIHTGAKPFICEVCRKSFNRKSSLDRHMLIHSGKKSHVCDICNKSFVEKSTLKSHKRIHTGEKPYTCYVCSTAFACKPNLTRHIRTHIGKKPYSCDTCNKSFSRKRHFNCHKRLYKH